MIGRWRGRDPRSVPRELRPPGVIGAGDRILHVVEAGEVILPPPVAGRELWIKAMVAGGGLKGP
ncbi:MAG TPA: hypothetical protein PKW90_28875, partial [Myxococcota bacterium]|nr:hypothetical protein [Myxococcota bacterium]